MNDATIFFQKKLFLFLSDDLELAWLPLGYPSIRQNGIFMSYFQALKFRQTIIATIIIIV